MGHIGAGLTKESNPIPPEMVLPTGIYECELHYISAKLAAITMRIDFEQKEVAVEEEWSEPREEVRYVWRG